MADSGDVGGPGGGRAAYLIGLEGRSGITLRTRNADPAASGLGPGDRAALKVDEGAARLPVD